MLERSEPWPHTSFSQCKEFPSIHRRWHLLRAQLSLALTASRGRTEGASRCAYAFVVRKVSRSGRDERGEGTRGAHGAARTRRCVGDRRKEKLEEGCGTRCSTVGCTGGVAGKSCSLGARAGRIRRVTANPTMCAERSDVPRCTWAFVGSARLDVGGEGAARGAGRRKPGALAQRVGDKLEP
ncbi:hypothetical protein C8J57DRAFT_1394050 [Mycena rebaudengoi]|nr:hypothetical protein C8J57DRAFT_1397324 [Mycena rebaudengoi]KAJ7219605.1 hypothetical protein C8J57DRAFT_1394050 [Mycena rebaudengoi]